MQAQDQAVVVTTKDALSSAAEWLKAVCKVNQIKGAVGFTSDEEAVTTVVRIGTENWKRIEKFARMNRSVIAMFEKSPDWVKQADSNFESTKFVSADGRFQVKVVDRYFGGGGWKVATKTIGVAIRDLQPVK